MRTEGAKDKEPRKKKYSQGDGAGMRTEGGMKEVHNLPYMRPKSQWKKDYEDNTILPGVSHERPVSIRAIAKIDSKAKKYHFIGRETGTHQRGTYLNKSDLHDTWGDFIEREGS